MHHARSSRCICTLLKCRIGLDGGREGGGGGQRGGEVRGGGGGIGGWKCKSWGYSVPSTSVPQFVVVKMSDAVQKIRDKEGALRIAPLPLLWLLSNSENTCTEALSVSLLWVAEVHVMGSKLGDAVHHLCMMSSKDAQQAAMLNLWHPLLHVGSQGCRSR